MTNEEFLYTIYDSDLVDRAIEETKEMYKETEAEILYKMAITAELLPNRTGASEIYNTIQREMRYSYLHGVRYAVENNLKSTAPSKETFSEFHKNLDFAVLFDFSDNDFGLAMEAAAKTYCDEFNRVLHQIDVYDDNEFIKSKELEEFAEMCKVENIKEIMKCGFLSQRIKNCAEVCCGRIPKATSALEDIKRNLDYIPWDKDMKQWEKVDGEYVETESFPRFVTGTNAEIAEAIKKHGDPFDDQTQEFPVWCNGEVIILYMKNGYLTYLIR